MHDALTPRSRSWLGVWIPRMYIGAAVLMIPWTVFLAVTLPEHSVVPHFRWAWVVFDVVLCGVLARIGWLAHRRDPQVVLAAAAGSALLCADAWFDVASARGADDHVVAVVMAIGVELPGAWLCGLIASRALRRIAAHGLAPHASDVPESSRRP